VESRLESWAIFAGVDLFTNGGLMLRALGYALLLAVAAISSARAADKTDDAYQLVAFAAALNAASGGGIPGTILGAYPDAATCEHAAASITNPHTIGSAVYFHIMFFCVPRR
jgi:hypothetical protein